MAVSSVPFKPQPLNACQALQCDHVLLAMPSTHAASRPMQCHGSTNCPDQHSLQSVVMLSALEEGRHFIFIL